MCGVLHIECCLLTCAVAFTLGGSRGHVSSSRGTKMAESGGPSIPEEIKEEEEGEDEEGEEGEEGGEGVGEGEESGSSSGSHGNRGRSEPPLCSGDSTTAGGSGPTSPLGEHSVTAETPSSSRWVWCMREWGGGTVQIFPLTSVALEHLHHRGRVC